MSTSGAGAKAGGANAGLEQARLQLAYNVGAIEAKLNVPRRLRRARIVAADRLQDLKQNHPVALVAAAGAAAATTAVMAAAGVVAVRLLRHR